MVATILWTILFISGTALAQAPGELAPAEGAIKGGSIEPGERGGIPETAPSLPPLTEEEARARCNELAGTLREQCLRDLRSAGAGGTRPPGVEAVPGVRDPRQAPPPQNPR